MTRTTDFSKLGYMTSTEFCAANGFTRQYLNKIKSRLDIIDISRFRKLYRWKSVINKVVEGEWD